jgi:hypothetical protein
VNRYFICLGFSTDVADIWWNKAETYKKDYSDMLGVAVFDYDEDDDGNVEDSEKDDTLFQLEGVR